MTHVLVVEPDKELARIIQTYLEPNYTVQICHDAQTAISKADAQQPDVVILELAIPEHNGVAFLQEFRSYNDWAKIPVIIYSQIPREDTGLSEQEWAKLHIPSYLYKSTSSLAKLVNAVERAI